MSESNGQVNGQVNGSGLPDAKIPDGPLSGKWRSWLDAHHLVGPRNRPGRSVIVVGTGLAGASAAAT
ncbi:MAG: hypothetical protein ACO3ZZ_04040, partial [Solirubrobacterales bacterium]